MRAEIHQATNHSFQSDKIVKEDRWNSFNFVESRLMKNKLIFTQVVVCCCRLNTTQVCDDHLFGQVSTHTG